MCGQELVLALAFKSTSPLEKEKVSEHLLFLRDLRRTKQVQMPSHICHPGEDLH